MLQLCGVPHHGAELEHPKALSPFAGSRLDVEDRSGIVEPDQEGTEAKQDDRHGERYEAEAQIHESLDREVAGLEEPDRLTRHDGRLEARSYAVAVPTSGD